MFLLDRNREAVDNTVEREGEEKKEIRNLQFRNWKKKQKQKQTFREFLKILQSRYVFPFHK